MLFQDQLKFAILKFKTCHFPNNILKNSILSYKIQINKMRKIHSLSLYKYYTLLSKYDIFANHLGQFRILLR